MDRWCWIALGDEVSREYHRQLSFGFAFQRPRIGSEQSFWRCHVHRKRGNEQRRHRSFVSRRHPTCQHTRASRLDPSSRRDLPPRVPILGARARRFPHDDLRFGGLGLLHAGSVYPNHSSRRRRPRPTVRDQTILGRRNNSFSVRENENTRSEFRGSDGHHSRKRPATTLSRGRSGDGSAADHIYSATAAAALGPAASSSSATASDVRWATLE